MQIACPNCKAKLNLGTTPKPGRYKPKCKHCGRPFGLQVSEDDPPKVRVGKIAPKPTDPSKPTPSKSAPSKRVVAKATATRADVDQTLDATIDSSTDTHGARLVEPQVDRTVVPSETIQQTMDASAVPVETPVETPINATMDSSQAGSGSNPATPVSGGSAAVVSSGRGGSKVAPVSTPSSSSTEELAPIPQKLGGYKILRMLGRGAMGAVYQAQQISLDRNVALKTIRSRLAQNPASLARFTREAYAAAQLTHHNVVQIYDFGEDSGQHYFSMEWVRGGTLGDLVQDKGPIEPKLAASYILQAARGLQFAHRNGMVHRDVKPANLLLSDEGVVKVADLGLVKIPEWVETESDVGPASVSGVQSGTHVTMQGTAVGTPAYMAPEQGIDATTVDHRADIYSLGCSLFYMLAGKPPFDGSMVSEVLEMHAQQPIPDLTQINPRVPNELARIVSRCMAKQPSARYDSLATMIQDLDAFLGIRHDGEFSATTNQADQWEQIAAEFTATQSLRRLGGPLLLGLTIVSLLITLALPMMISVGWVTMGPLLWMGAIGTTIALGATGGRSPVATSLRRWFGTLSWWDGLIGAVSAVVLVGVLFLIGGLIPALVGFVLGAAAGAAYHYGLIAPTRKAAAPALERAERFIRDLRIGGADEDGLRNFAARYAGKRWEPFYESLFGYRALLDAKSRLKDDPSFQNGVSKASLRDRVCERLEALAKSNEQAKTHEQLAAIEERGLVSEGLSEAEARDRSWQMAAAVMESAKIPVAGNDDGKGDAEAAAQAKRARIKADLAEARSGKYKIKRDPLKSFKLAFSGYTRLLAGCCLLAIFGIWVQSSGLLSREMIESVRAGEVDLQSLQDQASDAGMLESQIGEGMNPWSIGIAGLLMALSAFVSGWRMTPFAIIATLVILLGSSLGVPAISILPSWLVAVAVGIIIYLPGILFGESETSQ